MRTKITGLAHGGIGEIQESVCIGNECRVVHDPEHDREEGLAWRVDCKGVHIGYIPLLSTLRRYYREAVTEDATNRIDCWGRATKRIREWLEVCLHEGCEEIVVRIGCILYRDADGRHVQRDTGEIAAIAVDFDEVEDW